MTFGVGVRTYVPVITGRRAASWYRAKRSGQVSPMRLGLAVYLGGPMSSQAGIILYAFLRAQRERAGQVAAPADTPEVEAGR